MKHFIATMLLLISFSSFAGSQFAVVGDSCWKCTGGSFKSGQIECTPERTAKLYEVNMSQCNGNNNYQARSNRKNYYQAPQKSNLDLEIEALERKLSRLKRLKRNY